EAQVARDGRDLGLRADAPRARHGLLRAEGPLSTPQERPCSNEIAELRHRDAPKRERRCIFTQSDALQCTEGVADGERPRRGCDQRVHRNPVTLVTLVGSIPCVKTISCPPTTARRRWREVDDRP